MYATLISSWVASSKRSQLHIQWRLSQYRDQYKLSAHLQVRAAYQRNGAACVFLCIQIKFLSVNLSNRTHSKSIKTSDNLLLTFHFIDCAGELRFSGRSGDRHRQPYAKRRRSRRSIHRCGRRGRGGRDGRHPVGAQVP